MNPVFIQTMFTISGVWTGVPVAKMDVRSACQEKQTMFYNKKDIHRQKRSVKVSEKNFITDKSKKHLSSARLFQSTLSLLRNRLLMLWILWHMKASQKCNDLFRLMYVSLLRTSSRINHLWSPGVIEI